MFGMVIQRVMSGQLYRYPVDCWAITLASALDLGEVPVHCTRAVGSLSSLDAPGPFGHEFIWHPYTQQLLGELLEYYLSGLGVWRVKIPLIFFHLVEWHTPERVIWQFGMWQDRPAPIDISFVLHKIDLRGKSNWDWVSHHARWLAMWEQRYFRLAKAPLIGENDCSDTYMPWYTSITRRFYSKHGEVFHTSRSVLGEFKNHICEDISEQFRQFRNLLDTFGRVNIRSLEVPHRLLLCLGCESSTRGTTATMVTMVEYKSCRAAIDTSGYT